MAYDGWLSFASTEIANVSRLQTYANAEIPGLLQNCDCNCDLLAEAVGDKPYTTPVNDLAPWVDDNDEDTWGFYGVMPLSISGLQDATGTYEMTPRVGHGSAIGRYRKDPIEFRVRALLVAKDEAALEAGYSWFKAAVGEGCIDNCGGGADFCYLSSCPTSLTETGGMVTEEITLTQQVGSDAWVTPRFEPPLPCGEIRWDISLSSSSTTTATITVRTAAEVLFSYQAEVTPGAKNYVITDLGKARGSVWVEVDGAVNTHRSTISARTEPAWQDCIDEYLRQVRGVVVVEGPRIIRDYSPTIGALREVEIVFSGAPYTFGAQTLVASVMRGTPTAAPRASISYLDDPPPPCEEEPISWRDVMVDPNCRIDPPPPLAKLGTTACKTPSGYNYAYQVDVPADMVPDWGDVVPSLRVTASQSAIRGVRVRILPNLLGHSARELDPCSECASFAIAYIPKGGAFVVDGMTERAYVEIADNTFSALHYLDSARPGTVYTWPSLSCGVPYTFIIEVAANNDVEGIELWLTPRE